MSDARHKGPYRKGDKLQGTKAWALLVDAKLAENKLADLPISDRAKLARLQKPKADKSGMNRFLDALLAGETQSSKYVIPISEALGIDLPLVEPDTSDDALAKFVARIPKKERARALEILRLAGLPNEK